MAQWTSSWPRCSYSYDFPLYTAVLSHVRLLETPRTVAHQAPLFMGLFQQEYWSGSPFPTPGDLPNPGIKPTSLASLPWRVDSLPLDHLGSSEDTEYQA